MIAFYCDLLSSISSFLCYKNYACQNFPESKIFKHLHITNLQKSSKIFKNRQKSSKNLHQLPKKIGHVGRIPRLHRLRAILGDLTEELLPGLAPAAQLRDGKIGEKIWKAYGPTEPFTSDLPTCCNLFLGDF